MGKYSYLDRRYCKKSDAPTLLQAVVFVILLGGVVATHFGFHFNYENRIGGYLKRAADANTIAIAEEQLKTALKNMDASGLDKGSSHIFFAMPSTDIGFWHNNLKTSLEELQGLSKDASALEKSNMLIKLRETILDHSKDGDEVTAPDNISIFPYQKPLFLLDAIVALFGTVLLVYSIKNNV